MKTTLITIAVLTLAGLATASASGRGRLANTSLKHHVEAQEKFAAAAPTQVSGHRTTFALSATSDAQQGAPRHYGTSMPRARR